jgi:DNA-binding CsgD family transcriptional regulator/PAS domain-containing protein
MPKHLNISQDQLLELITHIYDAGLDDDHWPHALHLLTTAFQAEQSNLRLIDTEREQISRIYHYNKDPHWLKAYMEYFVKIDPWMKQVHQHTKGFIDCSHRMIPDSEIRKTEYYSDYVEPSDSHYGVGGLIYLNPSLKITFSLQRSLNSGGFSNEHLDLIRKLVPHLSRSVLINRKTRQLEFDRVTLRDSLSQINSAMVVVNQHGECLFVNHSAEKLSREHHGISLSTKGISLSVPPDNDRLQKMIFNATLNRSDLTVPVAGGMKYHYPSSENSVSILVSPLNPDKVDFGFETTCCALIFLSQNQPKPGLSASIISQIYGLTEAEAQVTALLCEGLTLNEISEKLYNTSNTIKYHLKSVFQKTDTRRQAELVNLITTGPAGIKYMDQT